ncbi:MAG: hypothetical protein HXS41_00710 [Theionarchaea archaeon]|nr:hypothetical protein [Theionarchaea archaeon]MBU7001887.1 hypothetical protein [Theionarchaea archaeon]MBU7019551.1 hypothetical protein [Theionarchaea archaeon]MBU7035683.1 hypothetical protein [Theionarchaea archaeon]
MNRKLYAVLGVVLLFIISFIYITASGISHLSNETILFLFLDETKDDPGTIEVASVALFKDAHLQGSLIKVDPLSSTETLKSQGIYLSDTLIKSPDLEEGIQNAWAIAEAETHADIDRIVVIDAPALKSIIDAVHPIPVDIYVTPTVLDKSFSFPIVANVTGIQAEQCIKGQYYPGVQDETLLSMPEDYLWEVKADIINSVTQTLFDFSAYTPEEQKYLAHTAVEQYRDDFIVVYQRNTVLSLVYYLPESVAKYIVNFAVRRIA